MTTNNFSWRIVSDRDFEGETKMDYLSEGLKTYLEGNNFSRGSF